MPLVIDFHIHLYPAYNIGKALQILLNNLATHGKENTKCAVLTDASGQSYFRELRTVGSNLNEQLNIREIDEHCLRIESREDFMYLFSGRQIVSRERIEILALFNDMENSERLPAQKLIDKICEYGGVPVLSWAQGKWLFHRGKLVGRLLEDNEPRSLLVCDSAMRPKGRTIPRLFKKATDRGYKIIAGSDPLPFAGEEKLLGKYVSFSEGELDVENPTASFVGIISNGNFRPQSKGECRSFFRSMQRSVQLIIEKYYH